MEVFPSFICSICSDNYDTEIRNLLSTMCGHIFHTDCLRMWLDQSNTCPECRCRVTQRDTVKLHFNTTTRPSESFCDRVNNQLIIHDARAAYQNMVIENLQRVVDDTKAHFSKVTERQKTVLDFMDELMNRKWNRFTKQRKAFWERRISESNTKGLHHVDYEIYDAIGPHLLYITILPGKDAFHCDLCDCELRGGMGLLSDHVSGKAHQKKHSRKLEAGETFDDDFEDEANKYQVALIKMIQRQTNFENANQSDESSDRSVEIDAIEKLLKDIYASVMELYITQENNLSYTEYKIMLEMLRELAHAFRAEQFDNDPQMVVEEIREMIRHYVVCFVPQIMGARDGAKHVGTFPEIKNLAMLIIRSLYDRMSSAYEKELAIDDSSNKKNMTGGKRRGITKTGASASKASTRSESLDSLNTLANKVLDRFSPPFQPAMPPSKKKGKKNNKGKYFSGAR